MLYPLCSVNLRVCFPVQKFAKTGLSTVKLWPKTILIGRSSKILNFENVDVWPVHSYRNQNLLRHHISFNDFSHR